MPLHLIKLCVGVDEVEALERRLETADWLTVNTRMTPKRAAEIEDGGSLFWVIKGVVACRQPVEDIATFGEGKASRCVIRLGKGLVRTAPQARRPFQGWRYLRPEDAPADLRRYDQGELPTELALRLRDIGAW